MNRKLKSNTWNPRIQKWKREKIKPEYVYTEFEPVPDGMEVLQRRRSSAAKRYIFAMIVVFVLLIMMAGGYAYYRLPYRCVKDFLVVEAGEECPSVGEFLKWECDTASIVAGPDEKMEFNHVGDYEVVIHLYHQDVATILHVVDSTPPVIQTRNKTIMFGETYAPDDFLESVADSTDWKVSCKDQPDIQCGGIYPITLEVEDEGGNITEAKAQLEVLQDTTPPVIEGVKELTITEGGTVSYKKGVTVTDDYDDAVALEVDYSAVDTNTPGDYKVIYRAADKYGNVTEISTVLHVKQMPIAPNGTPITEEMVNAEADKILASITDSSMSQYEVIKAIYNWTHGKVAYKDGTPKSDWLEGAYYGLVLRKGDCYVYAMTAKCLLTRAGIINMDIERIRVGNGMHFWNLVDIGEGWHHFDTCRRADGSTFFYLTDAELMAYSNTHTAPDYPDGSHNYDRTLYPEIP